MNYSKSYLWLRFKVLELLFSCKARLKETPHFVCGIPANCRNSVMLRCVAVACCLSLVEFRLSPFSVLLYCLFCSLTHITRSLNVLCTRLIHPPGIATMTSQPTSVNRRGGRCERGAFLNAFISLKMCVDQLKHLAHSLPIIRPRKIITQWLQLT